MLIKRYIMRKKLKSSLVLTLLLFIPSFIFSQTLELGLLSTFEAYTGSGAATNSGTFTGDVGSNDGAISGFTPPSFNGTIYNDNAVTVQARIDLLRVYIHLSDIFVTHPNTHSTVFGNQETLSPGVYSIGGAGSLAGIVTLDGGGNTDAVFIIKFEGAFTAGVGSSVVLINGTRACNVFWIAEGAISIGASSTIKGTLYAHPGALTIGTNCNMEGRLFSSEGAITIGAGSISNMPAGPISVGIYCLDNCSPASAVNVLGSVAGFTLFTSDGAVANAATSGFIGDIGSDDGAVSGFVTSTKYGSFHNADATTAQAKIDLENAYSQLINIPITHTAHAASFGSGETLNAGVYFIGGAGSLSGTINLDANNNPDAIFIFRFNGAFSVAAQSRVIFRNGTRRCNVFWIAEGAASMGTFTFMKGTVIAHDGACTMGANGNLEGRMLSTDGAIGFSTGVAYNTTYCFTQKPTPLPIELLSFTVNSADRNVQLNWITATEINNDYFNVERSSDGINFTSISKTNGAGNSTNVIRYSSDDDSPLNGLSYYRLKQTDFDGKTSYSSIESVTFNNLNYSNYSNFNIYPNPFSEETIFNSSEKLKDAMLVVYNSYGQVVKQMPNISGHTFTMQRENLSNGLYFVNLIQDGKMIATNKIVITD